MGPIRPEKSYKVGESSSSASKKPKRNRVHTQKDSNDSSTLPGIQKLKASLRQTRRLLAKDKLAADVRVETERRLKALEADIAQAESAKKERSMSVRYHKAKFFERQKVVRKINQTKKRLATIEKSSSKKKADAELLELRIDLNYILHYPKTRKYISLFPPEVRQATPNTATSEVDTAKTISQRDEVRAWIQEQMGKGELEREPDLHLDSRERGAQRVRNGKEWDDEGPKSKMKSSEMVKDAGLGGVKNDAFFGDDDDDEEEEMARNKDGEDESADEDDSESASS